MREPGKVSARRAVPSPRSLAGTATYTSISATSATSADALGRRWPSSNATTAFVVTNCKCESHRPPIPTFPPPSSLECERFQSALSPSHARQRAWSTYLVQTVKGVAGRQRHGEDPARGTGRLVAADHHGRVGLAQRRVGAQRRWQPTMVPAQLVQLCSSLGHHHHHPFSGSAHTRKRQLLLAAVGEVQPRGPEVKARSST